MPTEPADETTPAPNTLPVALVVACLALALVLLVAPIRDRLVLAAAVLLAGAVAAVIAPTWFRPRP